jgi:hypothetical protein
MSALISSLTAITLAAGLGTTGAAAAPVPAAVTDLAPAFVHQQPRPPAPPHNKFRVRFSNEQQCRAQASREHPGRPGDWDCRRGPDRAHPWEYWSR